ncbi:hypothetical protein ACVWXP_001734 [Bradyrhizobium sp. USDA 4463]
MNYAERVVEFVSRFPGRDDDEIAAALKIAPRQTVNMICRRLCEQRIIRRERGPRGKLVNYASQHKPLVSQPAIEELVQTSGAMSEDEVKSALKTMLEGEGWSVEVAWGRMRGIDIVALRGAEKWIIECKGTGSIPPMQNNYFVGVVGELLQRMTDERAKHSIAFPDVPKFRRLWAEFPPMVKERLKLSALYVSGDGSIVEVA